MKELGERLRRLRESVKLSQVKMAELLGVKQSSINRYEQGQSAPSLETLVRYADYFDVSLDYLLGRTDEKNEIDLSPHRSAEGIRCLETEATRDF